MQRLSLFLIAVACSSALIDACRLEGEGCERSSACCGGLHCNNDDKGNRMGFCLKGGAAKATHLPTHSSAKATTKGATSGVCRLEGEGCANSRSCCSGLHCNNGDKGNRMGFCLKSHTTAKATNVPHHPAQKATTKRAPAAAHNANQHPLPANNGGPSYMQVTFNISTDQANHNYFAPIASALQKEGASGVRVVSSAMGPGAHAGGKAVSSGSSSKSSSHGKPVKS